MYYECLSCMGNFRHSQRSYGNTEPYRTYNAFPILIKKSVELILVKYSYMVYNNRVSAYFVF